MPWKPLQLSPSAGAHLPPLLISTTLSPTSYTVHLTDLTHIWSESLSKKEIIRRSREESTSIDPSHSDQLQIFLEKIETGLAGEQNTTLALTISSNADRPSLVLYITVDLPGGLAPLEWPVKLSAAPQHMLTSQLVIPLLKAQHERLQELSDLTEVLNQKDHVIQKLMDKLEDQGTELGQVFPQAAGKAGRKVNRIQAEERVKGLGSFSMKEWSDNRGHEDTQNLAELLGEVFRDDSARDITRGAACDEAENWWDDMKGITVNLSSGKISTKVFTRGKEAAQKPMPKEDSTDDADFQVQATPPHLTKVAEESTDDEDLDASSQNSKIPDSVLVSQLPPSPPPKTGKKLGLVGRRKKTPAPEPEPIVEDETALEDDRPERKRIVPSLPERSPTPVPPSPKPKKRLGKIGGKKRSPTPEPELPPKSDNEPDPETPRRARKSKLGMIGGKNKQRSPTPDPEPTFDVDTSPEHPRHKIGMIGHKAKKEDTPVKEERGRTPKKGTPPKPRETSAERADKKRAQLKRELEEKAKAPPKKKRKF